MKAPAKLGAIAARIVADLLFRRTAKRVHQHGERVNTETLAHSIAIAADPQEAHRVVEQFAELSPEELAAAGGDQMPCPPLHEIPKNNHVQTLPHERGTTPTGDRT